MPRGLLSDLVLLELLSAAGAEGPWCETGRIAFLQYLKAVGYLAVESPLLMGSVRTIGYFGYFIPCNLGVSINKAISLKNRTKTKPLCRR